jgi:hypothetical protein
MNDIENFIISELEPYEKYGKTIQENGTKLIGKAIHIAPLAWLHSIYKGLNEIEIKEVESDLNTEIPKEYACFLHFSNGLNLFNTSLSLYGRRTSYNRISAINARQPFDLKTKNIHERPKKSKEEYFYIGSYFKDGSLIFIDKITNEIHRTERDEINILNSWSDFREFIESEIVRLKSLHNENGTPKNTEETTTPKNELLSKNKSLWRRIKGKFK